jgi:type II secretory pathway component PulC
MTDLVWVVNWWLAFLCGASTLLFLLVHVHFPPRPSLLTRNTQTQQQEAIMPESLQAIWQQDLFDTRKAAPIMPVEEKQEEPALLLPAPPTETIPAEINRPQPSFLPPLSIQLKGIILGSRPESTVAIVAHSKTGMEQLYTIGQSIEDSEIIHITGDSIMIVRPNGQQETLFIDEDSAKKGASEATNWSTIIEKTGSDSYRIDVEEFIERIASLSHFIQELDLTTTFTNGVAQGCIVGSIAPSSVAVVLGLQAGDIIRTINTKPLATLQDRLALLEELKAAGSHQLDVSLTRNNVPLTLHYILLRQGEMVATNDEKHDTTAINQDEPSPVHTTSEKRILPASAYDVSSFAEKADQDAMMQYGGQQAVIRRNG